MSTKPLTKTIAGKSNRKELSPSEWNTLHRDALILYCDAVWNLAEVLKLGKEKFGRNTLWEMTPLPHNKVSWLIGIASTPKNENLLPEHHFEVIGLPNAKKWLKKAESEHLDPVELRKEVRKGQRKVKKEKKVQVSSWAKNFVVLQKELEILDPEQRQRITDHIKSQLK